MGCNCSDLGAGSDKQFEVATEDRTMIKHDNNPNQIVSNQTDAANMFSDLYHLDSVERYNVKYRPRDNKSQSN
jgi:hypothetical protein